MADFLESQREWVVKTLEKQQKRTSELLPVASDGPVAALFFGVPLAVVPRRDRQMAAGMARIEKDQDTLLLDLPPDLFDKIPVLDRQVQDYVQQWLRAQAKAYLTERAQSIAKAKGFNFNRLFIRSQTTKWGTCSTKGNISLNWKLIQCPPFVIDYLVVHELCHLLEMNHSASYWGHVAHHCPDYRKAEAWLKRYGSTVFGNY